MKDRLAVIITCHNRREITLGCLEKLFSQEAIQGLKIDVYLTDDESTDGTKEAVIENFPSVKVLNGTGMLYWNRGMHRAWAKAMKFDYYYYLWLNDDTFLYPDALKRLMHTSEKVGSPAIVTGSTVDPKNGEHSYGGLARISKLRPLKFYKKEPGDNPVQVDTFNGNCVLIPGQVTEVVGNLDHSFTHSIGDVDYGLRAVKQGVSVFLASGYHGTCPGNDLSGTWQDTNLTFRQRFKLMTEEKGIPLYDWYIFARRHAGMFWMIFWLMPYFRVMIDSMLNYHNKKQREK